MNFLGVLGALVVAALICMTTEAWPTEQVLSIKASNPAETVRLLTAPHTGKKICDIADATPIKFFQRADHGPHKFAKVEVLEGNCAGEQGYVPWLSLDPEPQEN